MEENEYDYIEEKDLSGYSKSLSNEEMKILMDLNEKKICKIECNDGDHGTGFFCMIPFLNDWDTLSVLMTNYHVLKENDILPGKIIKFSLNNDKKKLKIKIDELRITFTSKKYDITIIEIKKEDGLNRDSFLEIDNEIFDNLEKIKQIYIFISLSKRKRNKLLNRNN